MKSFSVLSLLSLAASLASATPAGNYDTSLPACPFKLQVSYTWGGTPQTTFLDDIGGPVAANLDDSGSQIPLWTIDRSGRLSQYRTQNYLLKDISYVRYTSQAKFPGNDGLIIQPLSAVGSDYSAVQCRKNFVTQNSYGGGGYNSWRGPPPKTIWLTCFVGYANAFYECDKSNSGWTSNPQKFFYLKGGRPEWRLGCRPIYLKVVPVEGAASFGQCNPTI